MNHIVVADVVVASHTSSTIRDDEWDALVETLQQQRAVKMLVFTFEHAHPNTMQRARMNRALEGKRDVRVAVLTESIAIRGAVRAFSWFGAMTVQPFSASQLEEAVAFLQSSMPHSALMLALDREGIRVS